MDGHSDSSYAPRHSPPSRAPFSQPPSSQIAPQQPSFDPFQRSDSRRDPFMPISLANRRDSQPSNGRMSNNIAILQPPVQRPPSPYRHTQSSAYSNNERRNSPETRFSGASVEPGQSTSSSSQHQQNSSFFGRHMPPPSTSPKGSPVQSYSNTSSARPPFAQPTSKPRDANQRSTGSMSIQSIMSSDQGPPPTQNSWSSASGRSPPSTSYSRPLSPPGDRRYNPRRDVDGEPAPHTPIRRPDGPSYTPYDRPSTAYPSPSAASSNTHHPSDRESRGFSRFLQPLNNSSSEHNAAAPARPYSQPSGAESHPSQSSLPPYESRITPGARDGYIGGTFEKAVRDRSFSEDRRRHSPGDPPGRPPVEPFSPVGGGPLQPMHTPYQPRAMDFRDPLLNGHSNRRDQDPQRTSTDRIATSPRMQRSSVAGQYSLLNESTEPIAYGNSTKQIDEQNRNTRTTEIPDTRSPPIDAQLRKSIEDSNRHSFSRFPSDFGRRPDRYSPLPQAVQGAQSQPAGLARDPGIKSEFGRMFSGLGSGVGSTPQPLPPQANGAATPRRSPEEVVVAADTGSGRRGGQTAGGARGGVGSRGGRRGKRVYPEDGRPESDDGDGRATLVTSTRGAKRNRYQQHSTGHHHHHHHPQGPHHHHYSRKAEDVTAFPLNRRTSGTAYNSLSGAAGVNNSAAPHHHHHHPHPNNAVPHHHHPIPKSVADARIKPPKMNVSTSPVLRSVAHLPRTHLGSQVYEPTLSLPAAASSNIDSPLSHQAVNEPNLVPRFDRSQSNSTYTIRVPRYYLTDTERQRICKARHLWGTDVYTDDSDPVAAAFHSGWIRGAWAGDVDVAIVLGLPSADGGAPDENENPTATLTAPPSNGPVSPPSNLDLHLTLLILPPLEKYTGTIWHGIKSRSWGDNHDGLSFKIDKVEWVDEGLGSRFEQRGGQAKRRRIGDAILSSQRASAVSQSAALNGVKSASHTLKNGLTKKRPTTSATA